MQEVVLAPDRTPVDDHHPMFLLQVVPERLGPLEHTFVVDSGQKFLDEFSSKAMFDLGHVGEAGKFHAEDRGGVLERHEFELAGFAFGVDEGQSSGDVRTG
jgi:hypothetical protein